MGQRRAHGAGVSNDGHILAPGQIGQHRADAQAQVGKGFPAGRGMIGQCAQCQRTEVGQIGVGAPFPGAKVLLPQTRVRNGGTAGPQRVCGLPATPRRADDPARCRTHHSADGGDPRQVAAIGGDVGAPAQATTTQRRRVADEDQLCRLPALHCRIPSFALWPFLLCDRIMSKTILITGGARSGKSVIAETKALSLGPRPVYIATAEVRDSEMAARVAEHQARRGDDWVSHAAPFELLAMIEATDGQGPRLVDCLTLWLTNLMLAGRDWQADGRALVGALGRQTDPVVIVTNEVGGGIVPDNKLARDFRDAAGLLNQWVAAAADEVILAVAGLPLKVK